MIVRCACNDGSNNACFMSGIKLPDKGYEVLLLNLIENKVSDSFSSVSYICGLRGFFLDFNLKAGCRNLLYSQCRGVSIVGGLHVGQQHWWLSEWFRERFSIPGIGDQLACSGDFILYRADGSLPRLPGNEIDSFRDVGTCAPLLFFEGISKASESDIFIAAADGIRPID